MYCLFICLLASRPVFAHRINVFAYCYENKIYTQSFFSDGSKVMDGIIEVINSSGKVICRGKTNAKGEFNFPVPEYGKIKIILKAPMGHRAETVLNLKP